MSIFGIFFWILLALRAIGFFAPAGYERANNVVTLILIALLGWRVYPIS